MTKDNFTKKKFKNTESKFLAEKWNFFELGEILEEVNLRCSELEQNSDLEVLSLTKNYGLIPQTERFNYRVATKDVSKYKVVKEKWIAYNPYVIWEGAIHALKKMKIGLVSPAYLTWRAVGVDPIYLDYILRTPLLIMEYQRLSSGAVNRRRSIKKQAFKKVKIPLPPISEQKKIASVLSAVQEAKEKTEVVIKVTKELKKSLMKHLFTYGPVSLEEAEKVKLKETEIGMIPEDWNTIGFEKSILKKRIKVGSIYRKNYKKIGKYPVVDQGQTLIVGYCDDEDKVFKDNLPVVVFGDHTRSFKFIDFPFVRGADGTKILTPNTVFFDKRFYYLALLYKKIPSKGYNRHYKLLKEKPLPLPPLQTQRRIADILFAVDNKIDAEENKKKALEDLFETLLDNLMTAKIRVNNLEIGV